LSYHLLCGTIDFYVVIPGDSYSIWQRTPGLSLKYIQGEELYPDAILLGEKDSEAQELSGYLAQAYSIAEDFCDMLSSRVKGGGFMSTLLSVFGLAVIIRYIRIPPSFLLCYINQYSTPITYCVSLYHEIKEKTMT
jgi:hypothetical protein